MSLFPFSRSPLLVLSILIIAVFGFRAFLSVPFRRGLSAVYKLKSRSELSMLTFNIWFAAEKMQERMAALGKIVENLEPDMLTFQEVTRDNLALLRQQKWFVRYYLIPPDITKEGSYFDIILTVFPVDKWHVYPFRNTPFNRKLVTAEIKRPVSSLKSPKFVIATTHLEHSGTYAQLREEHLKESLKMLSTYDNVCVMGDMNIEGQFDGDVILPWQWVDAWLTLPGNTNSNGNTWDQSKNPFIRKDGVESSLKDRFDRVFCKMRDFKVKEMKIVGNNHTVKTSVLPSDHFGLFTVIEIAAKTEEKHKKESLTRNEVYFKRPRGWQKLIKQ